ncbi:MAG: SET domain-containing protein [Patescibacteria group bacterium]
MLLVKTKLVPSKIQGNGLFADQFISKGAPIWKFKSGFDIIVSKDDLLHLSEPARNQFLNYCYLNRETDKYVLCFDDARFFNHSDNPNTANVDCPDDEEGIDIATKDIEIGEEITCNYKEFDADFDYKLKK